MSSSSVRRASIRGARRQNLQVNDAADAATPLPMPPRARDDDLSAIMPPATMFSNARLRLLRAYFGRHDYLSPAVGAKVSSASARMPPIDSGVTEAAFYDAFSPPPSTRTRCLRQPILKALAIFHDFKMLHF